MKKFDAVTTFDNKTFMPQIFLMVLLISQKEIMGIKSQVCFKIPTFVKHSGSLIMSSFVKIFLEILSFHFAFPPFPLVVTL